MAEHFNLAYNVIVNHLPNGVLIAQASILSSFQEASAWISADTRNYQILSAGLEVYRSPHEQVGYTDYSELIGLEAYLHSGRKIKNLIHPDHQLARELLPECIKVLIQSEGFVYKERGYTSQEDYLDHWYAINDKNCYTFSHPEDIETARSDYKIYDLRHHNLFNRSHSIHLIKDDKQSVVSGTFIDTVHEINIKMVFDSSYVILEASADHIRKPDAICCNSGIRMDNLVGHNFIGMNKNLFISLIGGPEGCIHLVDIVYDTFRIIKATL